MLVDIRATAAVFVVIPSHRRRRNIALPLIINGFCVPLFLSAIQSVQQAINARLKLGGHLISCRVAAGWRKELRHGLALLDNVPPRNCTQVCRSGPMVIKLCRYFPAWTAAVCWDAEMLQICLFITAVSSRRSAYHSDRGWGSIN